MSFVKFSRLFSGLSSRVLLISSSSSGTAATNLVISRGLKKLGYGRFLSVSRYRIRKGLPAAPSASGPLLDEPDWTYLDGTPGQMTRGQSQRYLRDQELGRTMVKFSEQFEAIAEMRKAKQQQQKTTNDIKGIQI